ncbi:MAG: phytoene desaturase family protein [Planctomycetota bacterium]|nr:phytoene desaturase family protein [Planctomycetota bacterium]
MPTTNTPTDLHAPTAQPGSHRNGQPRGSGPRVAVVGAGPGGLAAAALLAASGARVTLFEAQPAIGGRTARITHSTPQGAFHFDRGPTFFLMPYVLEEVFAAAGRRLADYVDLRRLDPMYRLVMGRSGSEPLRLDATQDVAEMARRISAIDERDGANFARFIDDNRFKLRHSESILRNPMRSPLDLLGPAVWRDALKVGPVLRPDLSVHDLLSKYFRNPHVRLAVSFQSKYLGMSPFDCPSLFTILPFIEYEYGVWHPIGGCHALMNALAEVARELGADIRTGEPVERVEFQGERAVAVHTAAGRTDIDQIVINADTAYALKKFIPPALRGKAWASDEAIDAKKYSCSTFMMYLGVNKAFDTAHHTIYVSGRYKENLDEISRLGVGSDDPSVYVCNPAVTDPMMAPAGGSALYVLVPTPSEQLSIPAGQLRWEDPAFVAQFREKTLDQIGRAMGLGDLRPHILTESIITPADWRRMNINHGATFNLAHNLGQMLHKRPQNKLPECENVYLVGGGTHPGSGLPTIFLSAQISTRLLCEDAGLSHAARRSVQKPALAGV